jgi:hypothetical protein
LSFLDYRSAGKAALPYRDPTAATFLSGMLAQLLQQLARLVHRVSILAAHTQLDGLPQSAAQLPLSSL